MYGFLALVAVAATTFLVAWLYKCHKDRKKVKADSENTVTSMDDYNFTYRNIKDD